MNIVIIGAGAMGCLYGGYLSSYHNVVMIDSYEPQVKALQENGILIEEAGGYIQHCPNISAYKSGEYEGPADLVIIFVKSNYTNDALEMNKKLFGDHTIVLTLQNGAKNDAKISRYVKSENIIIGTSKHNSLNLGNGVVKHTGIGVTTIGSNSNATDVLEKVNEVLTNSNFETVVSDDIQRIIWGKLFVNLSINTFTAITKTPIGFMYSDKNAWHFAKRLVYEAIDVAEEDGTYFDRREVMESLKNTCIASADGYSSMYQDVIHCRPTEIDAINGAIVEQAKLYGVPVPYNALIVDLIHAVEEAYKFNQK